MLLSDLLDVTDLQREIDDGYVRVSTDGLFTVLNYTEQAMFDRHWNGVTNKTRGLVVTPRTSAGWLPPPNFSPLRHAYSVVARPWDKFFNYGEHLDAENWDLEQAVEVTDKTDGSLGIIFHDAYSFDRPRIATRGSLTSDQAKHGQTLLDVKYPNWAAPGRWTVLVEIVYPENRIVLDYDGMDDLVLLGARDIETGRVIGPVEAFTRFDWPGPMAQTFAADRLTEALALPPRPNAEGIVIRFINSGLMVKVKQEDYVALHRIVTGLSRKTIWQALADQGSLDPDAIWDLAKGVPEEFADWIIDVYQDFAGEVENIKWQVACDMLRAAVRLGMEPTRKDFAAYAKTCDYSAIMFNAYDDRDPRPAIMKMLKPVGDTRQFSRSEDIA